MRKFFCVVLAVALACGLCGCEEKDAAQTSLRESIPGSGSDNSQSTPSSVHESSVDSEAVSETVSLPKCEIELAGKTISLPCKVKDLPEEITLDTEHPLVSHTLENGTVYDEYFIKYNDMRLDGLSMIYLEGDCSGLSDISEESVIGLNIDNSEIPMSYMGLTIGSDESEVKEKLGEYDKNVEIGSYYYIGSEGSVIFMYDSERKIRRIWVTLIFR